MLHVVNQTGEFHCELINKSGLSSMIGAVPPLTNLPSREARWSVRAESQLMRSRHFHVILGPST